MQGFPHHYRVRAEGGPDHQTMVSGNGLPDLEISPPPEFDGPVGYWSPETLLAAAVANCFILTFRSMSRHTKLSWTTLDVRVDAKLDKTSEGLRFTAFNIAATLTAPGVDAEAAEALMHKAEEQCLITRSLNAEVTLEPEVRS